MLEFIHWSVSFLFSSLHKWFNFRQAGNSSNQRCGHSGSVRICGQFRDGTRTNPMVHSGRVIRSGSTSGSHRCGGMLQLDRQLHCRTVFPTTIGKNLVSEFSSITFFVDTRTKLNYDLASFPETVRPVCVYHIPHPPHLLLRVYLLPGSRDQRPDVWGHCQWIFQCRRLQCCLHVPRGCRHYASVPIIRQDSDEWAGWTGEKLNKPIEKRHNLHTRLTS